MTRGCAIYTSHGLRPYNGSHMERFTSKVELSREGLRYGAVAHSTTATAPTKRLALRRTSALLALDDQSRLPGRLKRWLTPKWLNGIAGISFQLGTQRRTPPLV